MPHTTSAKKAVRQSTKRRAQNRAQLSALKTLVKKFRALCLSKEATPEQKETEFRLVSRRLAQAGAKNLIHKNAANRSKSRLAIFMNKSNSAAASAAPTA